MKVLLPENIALFYRGSLYNEPDSGWIVSNAMCIQDPRKDCMTEQYDSA